MDSFYSSREHAAHADGPAPHTSPQKRTASSFGALEGNWRRVSSTHTLQDLLDLDQPDGYRPANWRLMLWGVALIIAGIGSMLLCIATMLVLPRMPPAASPCLLAVQEDRYYHLLVPLTVPVTIIAVFINWLSMKLFKHNS